tara:strand:- start:435 stop:623 length:189 start_codon:yes stop_codon:yes gene_type:complete
MTLYREGTLLRDCLGDLWIVTGFGKQANTRLDCYVLVRLANSFISKPVYRIVHREMKLVSEA